MSGLPKPRSITSSPARRSSSLSWSVCAKTYGGSSVTRRNSITAGRAGRGCQLSRDDLAPHAAAAECGAGAELRLATPLREQRRLRMAGRPRVDALDLGQKHEEARAQEDRHLRREHVVVPEGDLVRRR